MFVPILSSLVLGGPIGDLMGLSIHYLFYSVMVLVVVLWIDMRVLYAEMRKEGKSTEVL